MSRNGNAETVSGAISESVVDVDWPLPITSNAWEKRLRQKKIAKARYHRLGSTKFYTNIQVSSGQCIVFKYCRIYALPVLLRP